MNQPKQLSDIRMDASGALSEDFFYAVSNENYSSWEALSFARCELRRFTVLHPRKNGGGVWFRAEISDVRYSTRCDLRCKSQLPCIHQRQPFIDHIEGDVYGGPSISDFVLETTGADIFVSPGFARRLRATNLTGYDLRPFKIKVNQSKIADPELLLLQPIGKNCERPMRLSNDKNCCPFCHAGPVVCQECGLLWRSCPECSRVTCVPRSQHREDHDLRLTIEEQSVNGSILEGTRWDGADFIGGNDSVYFSKRMFEWVAAIHAGPLIGIPARFSVDGITSEQRRLLDTITDVSTVER